MACSASLSGKNRIALIVGILMTATTLRVTLTGVAPLLGTVRPAYSLTTVQTGLLTALPLLAFALISPLAAPVARRFGIERNLFVVLLLIYTGIVIRSPPLSHLLSGSIAIVGGGIALGNVLLPGLVKRDFLHSVVRLTDAYSLTIGTTAALGSTMVALLVLNGSGWQGALLILMCFPLLALFLWLPQWWSQQYANLSISRALRTRDIWRSLLAWQVVLFLGINSLVYYVIVGWLPVTFISRGYSEAQADSLHGLLQLATAAPGLLVPLFLHHAKDQRGIAAFVTLMYAVDTTGLCLTPACATTWTLPFGFGSDATVILRLTFVGLQVGSTHQVATLSGMIRSVGHLLAACGPPLMGKIHDANGNWSVSLMDVVILSLLTAIFGLCIGRDKEIR